MSGKIFMAIPMIMAEVDAIGKNRSNKQQGFQYRSIDDVYLELHSKFAQHGVFTVPEVLESHREERATKSGGLLTYTLAKIKYRFYADDGSCFEAVVLGEGSDSGDKSSNKAMAVAHKYALTQVFAIPTDEPKDPDAESHQVVAPNKPAASPRPANPPSGKVSVVIPPVGSSLPGLPAQAVSAWKPGKAEQEQIISLLPKKGIQTGGVTNFIQDNFKKNFLNELTEGEYFVLLQWMQDV